MNTFMSDRAKEYANMMSKGEIPPHNWQYRVSKLEKVRIYDAYVSYYIGLVKSGAELPKKPPFRGLNKRQIGRIYNARGFGSTNAKGAHRSISGALAYIEKKKERTGIHCFSWRSQDYRSDANCQCKA